MRSRGLTFVACVILLIQVHCDVTNAQPAGSACPPLDLYFLVETSTDGGSAGFSQTMFFLRKIIEKYFVESDYTRVSLTIFNNTVRDVFDLNTYTQRKRVNDALSPALYRKERRKGNANVGNAMRWMAENKFTEERGHRANVSSVCVIIIEGKSADNVRKESNDLHQHCRVIAIGVNRADFFQLINIASEPTIGHVKTLVRYNDLSRQSRWLTELICVPPLVSPRLKRTASRPTSLTVSWEDQEYAESYTVVLKNPGSDRVVQIKKNIPKSRTFVEFTNLRQAATYVINAWAVGAKNKQGPKATLFSTTAIEAPVLFLNENSLTSRSVIVYWERNKQFKGANYYVTVRNILDDTVADSHGTFDTEYQVKKLVPGTGYSVEVKAIVSGISSASSNKIEFYTVPPAPKAEIDFSNSIAVGLSWPAIPGVAGYVVRTFDAEPGKDNQLVRRDVVQTNTFVVRPLLSGNKYKFTVTSQNKEGRESAAGTPLQQRTSPGNPMIDNISGVTTTTMIINWKPQKAAVKYRLVYQQDGAGFQLPTTVETVKTSVQLTHLVSGAKYQVQIQSFAEGGVTDAANVKTQIINTAPEEIAQVSVLETTTNSVQLRWSAVPGAVNYSVAFKPSSIDVQVGFRPKSAVTNRTNFVMENLDAGVRYGVTVTAITGSAVKGNASKIVYATTSPDVPAKPILESSTNSSLAIRWLEIKGAKAYIVSHRRDGRSTWSTVTVSDAKFSMNFLRDGTFYEFATRAIGDGNKINNVMSDVLRVQTVPLRPERVHVKDATKDSITLSWDQIRGAAYYIVSLEPVDAFSFISEREVTTQTASHTFNLLTPGETYAMTVRSVGSDDISSPISPVVTETTLPATPGQPEAISVGSNSVKIDWESMPGAEMYLVNVQYDDVILKQESEETQYTVTRLAPGTWVEISIQSVGTRRRVNLETSDVLRVQTAPAIPENFQASSVGTDEIHMTWDSVIGVEGYVLSYKSTGPERGFIDKTMFVEETSSVIDNLISGVVYEVFLYALGAGNEKSDNTPVQTIATLPVTPGIPEILKINSNSVLMKWKPVKGAVKYIVVARQQDIVMETEFDKTQVLLTGLKSGNFYDLSVISVGIGGENPEDSISVDIQTLPGKPTNVTLIDSDTTSISLEWDDLDGVKFYTVKMFGPEGFLWETETVRINEVTFDDLEEGEMFSFVITATSTSDKISENSDRFSVTTVPAVPEDPYVKDFSETSVTLMWEKMPGGAALSYIVNIKLRDGSIVGKVNTTSTTITIEDLIPGVWYEFSVQSVGSYNRINKIESNSVLQQTVPAQPVGIKIVNETTTALQLSWSFIQGAEEYKIEVMSMVDRKTLSKTSSKNIYWASNLRPGQSYGFTITAVAENGEISVPSDQFIAATMTDVPNPPHVHGTSNSTVDLEWDSIVGAVKYLVYVESDESEVVEIESEESHLTITDLIPGTWYDFYLKSIGQYGAQSKASDKVRAQTVPSVDSNLRVTSFGNHHINLEWNEIRGVVKYIVEIEWFDNILGSSEKVIETKKTTLELTKLLPGVEYDIHISVQSESELVTELSPGIHQYTLPATPGIPELLNATHVSIVIRWEPVNGAAMYEVEITTETNDVEAYLTNEATFVFVGLEPGVMHRITLQSFDANNNTNQVKSDALDVQTVPKEPETLDVESFSSSSLNINWKPSKELYKVMDAQRAYFYIVSLQWMNEPQVFGGLMTKRDFVMSNILTSSEEFIKRFVDVKNVDLEGDVVSIDNDHVAVENGVASYTFQTSANNVTVDDALPGTSYEVSVKSVGVQGLISLKSINSRQNTLPATTSIPVVTEVTSNSIRLEWDNVKGSDGFIINQTNIANGVTKTYDRVDNQITLKDLGAGLYYRITVFSYGQEGVINPKGTVPIRVQTFPKAPSEFTIKQVTTDSVTLSWTPVTGAKNYILTSSYSEDPENIIKIHNLTQTTFTIPNLEPGRQHTVQIETVSKSGDYSPNFKRVNFQTTPVSPNAPVVTGVTETTISLDWPDVQGASSYKLSVSSDEETKVIAALKSQIILKELKPGRNYAITMQSVGSSKNINSIPSPEIEQQTVPSKPKQITVTSVTTNTIEIKWTEAEGAASYEIVLTEEGNSLNTIIKNKEFSPIVVEDLQPGTMYLITMVTISTSNLKSAASDMIKVATVPSKAGLFSVSEVTQKTVQLSWQSVIGAVSYQLTVRKQNDVKPAPLQNLNSKTNSILIQKLSPGIIYEFKVRSTNKQGKTSEMSDPFTVQTVLTLPVKPAMSAITNVSATATWKPVVGAANYLAMLTDVAEGSIQQINADGVSISLENLKPGTSYTISVQAQGTLDRASPPSPKMLFHMVPSSPGNWRSGGVTPTTIKVMWDAVDGAVSYVARLRLADDVTKKTRMSKPSKVLSVIFDKLTPGVTYDFVIQAIGKDKKLSVVLPSDQLIVQTVPPVVQGVQSTNVTTNEIWIKWNPTVGAEGYIVRKIEAEGDVTEIITTENRLVIPDLQPGLWHTFTVQAVGRDNQVNPKYSKPLREQTVSSRTGGLQFKDVLPVAVTMFWQPTVGAASYIVFVRKFGEPAIIKKLTTEQTQLKIPKLIPGTLYSFSLRSVSKSGKQSAESDAKTQGTSITPPKLLSIEKITNTSISVGWEKVQGAVEYVVIVKENATVFEETLRTNKVLFTINDLEPGTWYNIVVKSVGSSDAESIRSGILKAQTTPSMPAGFAVDSITRNTITMRWEPVNGATLYVLTADYIVPPSKKKTIRQFKTTDTTIVLNQLPAGIAINIRMMATSNKLKSPVTPIIVENTLPNTPALIQVTGGTSSTLSLKWGKVPGAPLFQVDVVRTDVLDIFERFSPTPIYILKDLEAGATYNISVKSLDRFNRTTGDPTKTVQVQTAPAKADEINLVNVTTNSIAITWPPIYGARSYDVGVFWKTNKAQSRITNTVDNTMNIIKLPAPGTPYRITVNTIGSRFKSGPSADFIENTLPALPQGIVVGKVTTTTIPLTWKPLKGSPSFGLIVTEQNQTESVELISNANNFVIPDLRPGSFYAIQLFSRDAKDRTSGATTAPIRVQTIPPAPQGLRVTDVKAKSISVEWDQTHGAKSYIVLATWTRNKKPGRKEVLTAATSAEIPLQFPGQDYFIVVKARSGKLTSAPSEVITENTLLPTAGAPLVGIITTTNFTMKWGAILGAKGYIVNVTNIELDETRVIYTPVNSLSVNDLIPGAYYSVRVFAVDDKERATDTGSAVVNIQTNPLSPENVFFNSTTTGIDVRWDPVYGAGKYIVKVTGKKKDVLLLNKARKVASKGFLASFDVLVDDSTARITKLAPGANYNFSITAFGKYQAKRRSESYVESESTLPHAVQVMTVPNATAESAIIKVKEVPGATYFDVTYTNRDTGSTRTITTYDMPFELQNLAPATWYDVQMLSYDQFGRTNFVKSKSFEFQTAPEITENIQITNVKTTSMAISWDPTPKAVSYLVRVAWEVTIKKKVGRVTKFQLVKKAQALKTTSTNQLVTKLLPGTQYFITVSSFAESGRKSEDGEIIEERTVPQTVKTPPIVKEITATGANFTWKPVKGAFGYLLRVTSKNDSNDVIELTTVDNSTNAYIDSFASGTIYLARIFPIGEKDRVNPVPSDPVIFKTTPVVSTDIEVVSYTPVAITIKWISAPGGTHFKATAEYNTTEGVTKFINVGALKPLATFKVTPGTLYKIYVETFGSKLRDRSSGRSDYIIQRSALPPPANVAVTNITDSTMKLTWNPVKNALTYNVRVIKGTTPTLIELGNQLEYEVVDMDGGQMYKLQVQGLIPDENVFGAFSPPVGKRTKPLPPSIINASYVDQDDIELMWDIPPSAVNFRIIVFQMVDGERVKVNDLKNIKKSKFRVQKLKPATVYGFLIISVAANKFTSVPSEIFYQKTAPVPPKAVRLTKLEPDSMSVTWTAVEGVDAYEVIIVNPATKSLVYAENTTTLNQTFTDLQPGVVYAVSVRAMFEDEQLKSARSKPLMQRTRLLPPVNLKMVTTTPVGASLSWNKVIGAATYLLSATNPILNKTIVKKVTANTAKLDKLIPSTEYEYRVQAVTKELVPSYKSEPIFAFTLPSKPKQLTIASNSPSSFNITWPPAGNAADYIFTVRPATGQPTVIKTKGKRWAVADGLESSKTFTVSVRSVSEPGVESVESDKLQVKTLPFSPTGLVVTSVTETEISLQWKPVEGVQSYTLIAFQMRYGAPVSPPKVMKALKVTKAKMGKLKGGVMYRFATLGVTKDGRRSLPSEPVFKRTIPLPPLGLAVSNITGSGMQVTWKQAAGATAYTLNVTNRETKELKVVEVENVTTTFVGGLIGGMMYGITIRSEIPEEDLISRSSKAISQTTNPGPPTEVSFDRVFSKAIEMSWKPPRGGKTYIVYPYEVNSEGERVRALKALNVKVPSARIVSLKNATVYEFEIIAITVDGLKTERSRIFSQKTKFPPPIMPKFKKAPVVISNVTKTTMLAKFPLVLQAETYTIVIRSLNDTDRNITGLTDLEYKIRDLTPGVKYQISFFGVGKSLDESPEGLPKTIVTTHPFKPDETKNLRLVNLTHNAVMMSWDPADRALSYVVRAKENIDDTEQFSEKITGTKYTFKNLITDRLYTFHVVGIGKYENSTWSDPLKARPQHPVPVMISNPNPRLSVIILGEVTWNSIAIAFPKLDDAVSYNVILRQGRVVAKELTDLTENKIVITDVNQAQTYAITYKGKGSGGDFSAESSPALMVTTLAHLPEPPTNVTIEKIDDTTVIVSWEPGERALSYEVRALPVSSGRAELFSALESPYTVSDLKVARNYELSVRSVGRFAPSEFADPKFFKTGIPQPDEVRKVEIEFVNDDAIWLSWTPVAYAASYTVVVTLNDEMVQQHKLKSNKFRLTGLQPYSGYKLAVTVQGFNPDPKPRVPVWRFVRTLAVKVDEPDIEEETTTETPTTPVPTTTPPKVTDQYEVLKKELRKMLAQMDKVTPSEKVFNFEGRAPTAPPKTPFRTNLQKTTKGVQTILLQVIEPLFASRSVAKSSSDSVGAQAMEDLITMSKNYDTKMEREGQIPVIKQLASILTRLFLGEEDGGYATTTMRSMLEKLLSDIVMNTEVNIVLKVKGTTPNSITVSVTGVSKRNSVDVVIREKVLKTVAGSYAVFVNTNALKFQQLQGDTEYVISVYDQKTRLILESKEARTLPATAATPPTPTGLTAGYITANIVGLRWHPVRVSGVPLTYTIRLYEQYSISPKFMYQDLTKTSFYVQKLEKNSYYYFTVSATDTRNGLESAESKQLQVRTKPK